MAEDVRALTAVAADEMAHVLDDAEYANLQLMEHHHRLAHIGDGHALRSRDNDSAATGTLWAMLRETSPVPGGRSTTR